MNLFILSAFVSFIIKFIPFKTLMKWFTNSECYEEVELTLLQKSRLRLVMSYLDIIEEISPWRVMCYEKAIMSLILSRMIRVNIAVYFGVKRELDGSLTAHAWTETGGYMLSGASNAHQYKAVFTRAYLTKNNCNVINK